MQPEIEVNPAIIHFMWAAQKVKSGHVVGKTINPRIAFHFWVIILLANRLVAMVCMMTVIKEGGGKICLTQNKPTPMFFLLLSIVTSYLQGDKLSRLPGISLHFT